MWWRRRRGGGGDGLLAKVNFPPYSLQMLTGRHVLVGGGGGSSRTGIANGFEVFEIWHDGSRFVAEELSRYETGPNVVMNAAVHNDGKRLWLVAGQESHCQLYSVQTRVVSAENGQVPSKPSSPKREEELRRRRNGGRREEEPMRRPIEELARPKRKKKLQLTLKPADSVQTDFSKQGSGGGVQRVVRVSLDGRLMATGGTDCHIRVWSFPQLAQLHELQGHCKEIDDIDFCPSGRRIASCAKDGQLLIWDLTKPASALESQRIGWNPSAQQRANFKRCRFRRPVLDADSGQLSPSSKDHHQLFCLSNCLPAAGERAKLHHGYLQLWDLRDSSLRRMVTYRENLSELAVSDEGKFVAVGTMSSGSVDIYVAFSLQRLMHVPNAHNMFVTGLHFVPSLGVDGPTVTSPAEAALISCSVDNKICIHSLPHRHSLPFWLFVLFIVISICCAFALCSYLGV